MELSWIERSREHGRILLTSVSNRLFRERRRERARRKLRRRLGDDPAIAIGSASEALDVADALLECVPFHHVSEELWASFAASPLAALLFASSAQGNAGGIEWVRHSLVNIDADATVARWREAAEICRRDSPVAARVMADALLRVVGLESRQRNSAVYVMRAAIDSWLPGRLSSCG